MSLLLIVRASGIAVAKFRFARIWKAACSPAAALAMFLLPCLLHAQFQQPTSEEVKMTADPKAPGAAAVYLYREDVTDDYNHFHSYYERIKILTEKGKELATIHIPYLHGVDTVNDVQGRTIQPDGTIVSLNAKPADLMDYKGKDFQVNTVVFTLPDAQVGSILEYRLKIREPDDQYSQPTWSVQTPYFIHKAHFSYHPYVAPGYYIPGGSRMMYSARLGGDAKVNLDTQRNLYSLDVVDVPPLPKEDWMPPINTLEWRVEFYYTNVLTPSEFWIDAGKQWAKSVEGFINPNGGIKKIAATLVATTDNDEEKAKKIYAAVQKLDNTAFSRKKTEVERKKEKIKEIHKAEDVWKEQSGSDDDIALLYVSLSRAAGLKAWPMQVVDRNRAIFDSGYFSVSQLDDYIVVVELSGKDVYLDPGQKLCPFGLLSWKHTLASGFRLTPAGAVPAMAPAASYKAALLQRIADLTVGPSGDVMGTIRIVMEGPDALHWRQLTIENDQDEVKKQFSESIQAEVPEGVQVEFDHFLALNDYESDLLAVIKVKGNIGTATGKHFFLPGLFFEARSSHPFVADDKRSTPIDVQYAKTVQDDVTYHLPAGYSIENKPDTVNAAWPNRAALKISYQEKEASIEVTRALVYNFTILEPKEYPNLHDFYQKVATADQQQLVLTRATAEKGN